MKKMTKMIAAGLMLVAGFIAAPAQAETPDYLSFTAVGGDVTIGMTPYGSPSVPPLETSADPTAETWNTFTAGTTTIALADGETVYFRRSDATATTAFNAQNDGWTFTMTGTGLVDAGGVITSLIRQDCSNTSLGQYAYQNLFQGCARLRTAPSLPATSLGNYSYKNLFDGCSNLERVTVGFARWNSEYTYNWLNGVAATGYFFAPKGAKSPLLRSAATIPSGWYAVPTTAWSVGAAGTKVYAFTDASSHLFLAGRGTVAALSGVVPKDILASITTLTMYDGVTNAVVSAFTMLGRSDRPVVAAISSDWQGEKPTAETGEWYGGYVTAPDYLSFTAVGGSVTIGMEVQSGTPQPLTLETATSKDGPWTLLRAGKDSVTVADGTAVYFRRPGTESVAAIGVAGASSWCFKMTGSGKIDAGGTVMSILDRSGNVAMDEYAFYGLFAGCTLLQVAPALPAKSLTMHCYNSMFAGCTSLTEAPVLPATKVGARCYCNMFSGCTALTEAPALPANEVSIAGYLWMFRGCISLTKAPALPATKVADNCYDYMFTGCTGLKEAPPVLPATTMASQCYRSMFSGCISLTNAPALPATELAGSCYQSMFSGCTSLTEAPALPATTLAGSCYYHMFDGCKSLTNAPALPATQLVKGCYSQMFSGCSSLMTAPEMAATNLSSECCRAMFSACSKINRIEVNFTDWEAEELATYEWVGNVAPTGTFVAPADLPLVESTSRVPIGWLFVPKGSKDAPWDVGVPGTEIKAWTNGTENLVLEGAGTIDKLGSRIAQWDSVSNGIASIVIPSGVTNAVPGAFAGVGTPENPVELTLPLDWTGELPKKPSGEWYGAYVKFVYPNYLSFTADGGDVTIGMTKTGEPDDPQLEYVLSAGGSWQPFPAGVSTVPLTDGDTMYLRRASATPVKTWSSVSTNYWSFTMESAVADARVDADGNTMSLLDRSCAQTEVGNVAFNSLFRDCAFLRTAAELPATTLADYCYYNMFSGCTGLTEAPALPAMTLARGCYSSMFFGCTGLADVSALPATTLANSCYSHMFSGCASLAEAPALPAETLAVSCYEAMFKGCVSLTVAPDLPAMTMAGFCYDSMFRGCTSLIEAPELLATEMKDHCYAEMFIGCTSLTTGPTSLPMTESATYCCYLMFKGCSSLTNAPAELPAVTLKTGCYQSMFEGCKQLTCAPMLPATELAGSCYNSMFVGCAALTNAPALPATNLASSCYSSMFSGCKSLTRAPDLPAETLASRCYANMFNSCTVLVTVPEELPAETLASSCYLRMFDNCGSLTNIPVLKAKASASASYEEMLWACKKLNRIEVCFTEWTGATRSWVGGVAPVGTFVGPAEILDVERGSSTIPVNWNVIPLGHVQAHWDVGTEGTTVTAWTNTTDVLDFDGTGTIDKLGERIPSWDAVAGGVEKVVIPSGVTNAVPGAFEGLGTPENPVELTLPLNWPGEMPKKPSGEWYGGYVKLVSPNYLSFTADGGDVTIGMTKAGAPADNTFEWVSTAGGAWTKFVPGASNVTVIAGDTVYFRRQGAATATVICGGQYAYWTFKMTSATAGAKVDADGNLMSLLDRSCKSTTVGSYAFRSLFDSCTLLRTPPSLPATYLPMGAYYLMFNGCTSLKESMALPATGLDQSAYNSMFTGCTSLTNAPALPATTVSVLGYAYMFKGCTSLTVAPKIAAKTVKTNGCASMFEGCVRLKEVPALPMKTLADGSCSLMFKGCSALMTIPDFAPTTVGGDACKSMFENSALRSAPTVLPATTLASSCYANMFAGCANLTNAPALPAMTLGGGVLCEDVRILWLAEDRTDAAGDDAGECVLPANVREMHVDYGRTRAAGEDIGKQLL